MKHNETRIEPVPGPWWRKAWEKHKAKARLRAAAPDLLAACYGLWTVLVMVPVDWDDPKATESCEDKTRAIDKARAAIYRAEGRISEAK